LDSDQGKPLKTLNPHRTSVVCYSQSNTKALRIFFAFRKDSLVAIPKDEKEEKDDAPQLKEKEGPEVPEKSPQKKLVNVDKNQVSFVFISKEY
jgi:hypothetical protein